MSRVNLLPPEVRRERRDAALVRQIRFAALCGVLLLGGLYGIRTLQLVFIRGDIDDVRAEQTVVRGSIAELADVAAARDGVARYRTYVAQILAGEVLWSEQLVRVASAVPPGFVLTSLTGQAGPDPGTGIIGSITFSGSSPRLVDARSWLSRIATEEGWANGWLSSLQGGEGTAGLTFTGSVDLTVDAISERGRGGA